ncbi:MAG: hypothetical protein NTV43_02110 [Methylococcales bacterium]|nr:hypothetical protein [Methylococcales bacterium]
METYLPIIQTTLAEWLQLAISNPWYAGAIAITVFLLTATLYSFKVGSLKADNLASEKAHAEREAMLNGEISSAHQVVKDTQQQIEKIQEELAEITLQMQKDQSLAQNEAQRAAKFEAQLTQRNQQIAATIQTLATSFDLGERPLPLMGDIKAEGLWQQHDRVITLLSTRLRSEQTAKGQLQESYQAEVKKRTEQEALLEILQTSLNAQTEQIAQHEQALAAQTSLMQQQQAQVQLELSQAQEKQGSLLVRIAELEQQALGAGHNQQAIAELQASLKAKDALISQLEKTGHKQPSPQPVLAQSPAIEPVALAQAVDTISLEIPADETLPQTSAKEPKQGVAGKLKNLFGKAKPLTDSTEPESYGLITEPVVPAVEPTIEPVVESQVTEGAAQEHKAGIVGKVKNLFGKAQQEAIAVEQIAVEEVAEVLEEIQEAAAVPPVSTGKSTFGKLKNLMGSKSAEVEEVLEEIQEAVVPPVSTSKSTFGKLKNLLGSKTAEVEDVLEEIQEAVVVPPVSPDKGTFGKLKNLFGSKAADVEEVLEEIQEAVDVPPASTGKGAIGKIKGLFGKS